MLPFTQTLADTHAGQRLDSVLAQLLPTCSRARIQQWIKSGAVRCDGQLCRARDKVRGGEQITIEAVPETTVTWQAQAMSLSVVFEDEDILIIDKPVGMVVHPAAGNAENTLANALLHYLPQCAELPRAGIVHRLDKNTSGLLVVAKTAFAHQHLTQQLQQHRIYREYLAIVNGLFISGGTVNQPLGRHPQQRQKRAVIIGGKSAVTHYRVLERFRAHSLLKVILETGRTHQIRVHMAHLNHPLLGDKTYGARPLLPRQADEALIFAIQHYTHQALHARRLHVPHPHSGKMLHFTAPVPSPLQQLIDLLRADADADAHVTL